ncbi:biotin carboxyl carrier protein [Bradyrhizobium elkanii]
MLRFFDKIRFFPVGADELLDARAAFPHGQYDIRIEEGEFSYADYAKSLAEARPSIAAFKATQQSAFDAERQRWREMKLDETPVESIDAGVTATGIPDGQIGAFSEVPGNIWKVLVEEGAKVAAGDVLAIIESMKMEISVHAPAAGRIASVPVKPGQTLRAGDVVALLRPG